MANKHLLNFPIKADEVFTEDELNILFDCVRRELKKVPQTATREHVIKLARLLEKVSIC